MDLKELVKQDLVKVKQKELDIKKEKNKNLKEIIIYTNKSIPNAFVDKMFEYFKEVGIKYIEKDIKLHPHIISTVQLSTVPVVEVNGEYLVWQRDFQSYTQCEIILKNIASEDYIKPSTDEKIFQALKNLTQQTQNSYAALNRQLQPIVKIMNELAKEENEEKNN